MGQPADLVAAARAAGVTERRLLDAIAAVPRAAFVPSQLAERAYDDIPLPIPHDQVTTQPSLVARMVAALELAPVDRVLEIGTGSAGRPRSSPGSPSASGASSAGRTSPPPPGRTSRDT